MPPKQQKQAHNEIKTSDRRKGDVKYPPVGGEEREIRYLKSLRHLADQADSEGHANKFTEFLRQRLPTGVPLPNLLVAKLQNDDSAQANLKKNIDEACRRFEDRLYHRVKSLPAKDESNSWFDAIFDILRCIFRNVNNFKHKFIAKLYFTICECRRAFPPELVKMFEYYTFLFEHMGCNDGDEEKDGGYIAHNLSVLITYVIDEHHPSKDPMFKQLSLLAFKMDCEEFTSFRKFTPGEWEDFKQLTPPNKTPVANQKQVRSNSTQSAKTDDDLLNDDDEWASDIDAEPEDTDYMAELARELHDKLVDVCDFLDQEDRLHNDISIYDYLYDVLSGIKTVPTDILINPRLGMVRAAGEILKFVESSTELYAYDEAEDDIERVVFESIDKVYTEVIHRRIEELSPLALWGTNEAFAYVLLRKVLQDFGEETPYNRKTHWGEVPVRGSGILEITDSKGGEVEIEAYYSPHNRKFVEKIREGKALCMRIMRLKQMPAVVPHWELENAGYSLRGNLGKNSKYCDSNGGSIHIFVSRRGHPCMPLNGLQDMDCLIETLSELKETPLDVYVEENEIPVLQEAMGLHD